MENDEVLLVEELAWVRRRLAALADVELKLEEMKCLAELARDHRLTDQELARINRRLNFLQGAIAELDRQTAHCNTNLLELRNLFGKTTDNYML